MLKELWQNEVATQTFERREDENGTRNLHVFVANTTDGISIAFSCSGDGYDWSMFTTQNTEVEYL